MAKEVKRKLMECKRAKIKDVKGIDQQEYFKNFDTADEIAFIK